MPSKFTLNKLSRKRCLANNKKKQAKDRRVLAYRPLILLSVSLLKKIEIMSPNNKPYR